MDSDLDPRQRLESALLKAMDCVSPKMRWGKDDCALWCADILNQALGYDAAASFRGRYRTKIGARRVLGRGGLAHALRAAGSRHGWKNIDVSSAQVGDVGISETDDAVSTVICRAPGWFVGRCETGWTAFPAKLGLIRLVWAVV